MTEVPWGGIGASAQIFTGPKLADTAQLIGSRHLRGPFSRERGTGRGAVPFKPLCGKVSDRRDLKRVTASPDSCPGHHILSTNLWRC